MEDLSRDVLYTPLGMTSTSSRFADYESRSDKALGHILIDGEYVPGTSGIRIRNLRRWSEFLDQRPHALACNDIGERNLRRRSDRESRRAVAGLDAPDGVESADTTRHANGLLRIRIQHRHDVGIPRSIQPPGAFELGAATNFVIIPRPTWRSSRCPTPHPPVFPRRLPRNSRTSSSSVRCGGPAEKLYADIVGPMNDRLLANHAHPAPSWRNLAHCVGRYTNDCGGYRRREGDSSCSRSGRGPDLRTEALGRRRIHLRLRVRKLPPGSISAATFSGSTDAGILRPRQDGNLHPMTATRSAGLSDEDIATRVAEGRPTTRARGRREACRRSCAPTYSPGSTRYSGCCSPSCWPPAR